MGFSPFSLPFYPFLTGGRWQSGGQTLADLCKTKQKKHHHQKKKNKPQPKNKQTKKKHTEAQAKIGKIICDGGAILHQNILQQMSNATSPCVPVRDGNWAGRLRSAASSSHWPRFPVKPSVVPVWWPMSRLRPGAGNVMLVSTVLISSPPELSPSPRGINSYGKGGDGAQALGRTEGMRGTACFGSWGGLCFFNSLFAGN